MIVLQLHVIMLN